MKIFGTNTLQDRQTGHPIQSNSNIDTQIPKPSCLLSSHAASLAIRQHRLILCPNRPPGTPSSTLHRPHPRYLRRPIHLLLPRPAHRPQRHGKRPRHGLYSDFEPRQRSRRRAHATASFRALRDAPSPRAQLHRHSPVVRSLVPSHFSDDAEHIEVPLRTNVRLAQTRQSGYGSGESGGKA